MNIEKRQATTQQLEHLLTQFNTGIVTITVNLENTQIGSIVTQCFNYFIDNMFLLRLFNHDGESCTFSFNLIVDDIISIEDLGLDDITISIKFQDGIEFILHKD